MPVKLISAGDMHSLFITHHHQLWGTGNNSYGQLGDGSTSAHRVLTKLHDTITSAAAGGQQAARIALRSKPIAAYEALALMVAAS